MDVVGLGGEFALDGDHVGYADGPGMANGGDAVPRAVPRHTKSAGDGPAGGTKMKAKRKGVNLCGRREGTAEVLTEELANEVCRSIRAKDCAYTFFFHRDADPAPPPRARASHPDVDAPVLS